MDGHHPSASAAHSLRSWRLDLPYQALPLSLNDRRNRWDTYRAQRNLRDQVRVLTRAQRIPRLERITVELHYVPAVQRTRDRDNAVATLKPAIDGLRDYKPRSQNGRLVDPGWTGIVADDSPEHVDYPLPIIHRPRPTLPGERLPSRLWLTITEVTP